MTDVADVPEPPAPRRSHRIATYSFLVAGTLSTFLAIAAIWVNRQVLETDNWTKTSSKLLESKPIRTELSAYLVDQLYANVDVAGELRQALPAQAQPLAGPAAGALRNLAQQGAGEILQRPRVQALWEDANRNAHKQLLAVINGGGSGVSTDRGVVSLDLGVILRQLADRTGVGGRIADRVGPNAAKIVVLRSNQLKTAQDVAKALRPLALVFTLLALVLFGAAIGVSGDRRRQTLRAAGFGFVIAGVLALLARSVGGNSVVDSLATTEASRPAIESAWQISTSLLVESRRRRSSTASSPSRPPGSPGRPGSPCRRGARSRPTWRDPAYAFGGVAMLILLLIWWGPTPATQRLVPGLILFGLIIAGVVALRRQTAREFPDASRPHIGASLRTASDRLRAGRAAPASRRAGSGRHHAAAQLRPTRSARSSAWRTCTTAARSPTTNSRRRSVT